MSPAAVPITGFRPVSSLNYSASYAALVFVPSLCALLKLRGSDSRERRVRCVVSGTGRYDGTYLCTVDRVSPSCNPVAIHATPQTWIATLPVPWTGRGERGGAIAFY